MFYKNSLWNDTIVAVATPPGVGAIGVIRLSGQKSFDIANLMFPSKDIKAEPSHTLHVGVLKDDESIIDEVVISIYKNPSSYTGEDVIEISCHGSAFVQQQILQATIKRGARLARPGEFTQRAFFNGKLDLTQAEGVADLIASNTDASKKAALYNIRGGFSKVLKELREQLVQFSSLIELELDFSEEDVEFADRTKFKKLIDQIYETTTQLLNSFTLGNVIKNGVSVAIVGKPNSGKSTLLNTLLNDNRAIVSDIPGTTRDTIEEIINIDGILFRLIDTAGIREHTNDLIENMGVVKSLEKMKEADIVLYLFDVWNMTESELQAVCSMLKKDDKKFILAGNKTDITDKKNIKENYKTIAEIKYISAKENIGIDDLKKNVFSLATGKNVLSENIILTNTRHYEALQEVKKSLEDINAGLDKKISGDLLALDIRTCLYQIGEITGEVTNEHRLDYIFSRFCIGK